MCSNIRGKVGVTSVSCIQLPATWDAVLQRHTADSHFRSAGLEPVILGLLGATISCS